MLTIPNLEKYRQGDFIQYMNNVMKIFDFSRVEALNVKPQFDALRQAMDELKNVWQPQTGSEITPEIVELDKQRDVAFNGFRMTVDAWATSHYREDMRHAAFVVSDMIAANGGSSISRMRYQQQTATVDGVIRSLVGPLSGHLSTLGLSGWVEHIRTLNANFDAKYLQRVTTAARSQTSSVEELIGKVIPAFRQLKALTEARIMVAEADGKSAEVQPDFLIKEFNELTQTYNDVVNRFTGKGEEIPADNGEQETAPATEQPAE